MRPTIWCSGTLLGNEEGGEALPTQRIARGDLFPEGKWSCIPQPSMQFPLSLVGRSVRLSQECRARHSRAPSTFFFLFWRAAASRACPRCWPGSRRFRGPPLLLSLQVPRSGLGHRRVIIPPLHFFRHVLRSVLCGESEAIKVRENSTQRQG